MKKTISKFFVSTLTLMGIISCQESGEFINPSERVDKVELVSNVETMELNSEVELLWRVTFGDKSEKILPPTRVACFSDIITILDHRVIRADRCGQAKVTAYLDLPGNKEYSQRMEIKVTTDKLILVGMEMLRNPMDVNDPKSPIVHHGESFQLQIKAIYNTPEGEEKYEILPFNDEKVVRWELSPAKYYDPSKPEMIFTYDDNIGVVNITYKEGWNMSNTIWVKLFWSHPTRGEVLTENQIRVESPDPSLN